MDRNKLQALASEWTRCAKNDIRTKVIEFMDDNDTDPRELAYALAISDGEMKQILEGNGEITITTFAKLLIATGNALEIKPVSETPIREFSNTPNRNSRFETPNCGQREPSMFNRHQPFGGHRIQRNRMDDNMPQDGIMPPPPTFSRDAEEFARHMMEREKFENSRNGYEHHEVEQPRDSRGRFMSRRSPMPQTPSSPFATMERNKLVEIIEKHLWDSEIDIANSSREELVKFLDNKDKRRNELKRKKELTEESNDPTVNALQERIRATLDKNPHLKEYVKNLLG